MPSLLTPSLKQYVVPVEMVPYEPYKPRPYTYQPEVGLRWGGPSSFRFDEPDLPSFEGEDDGPPVNFAQSLKMFTGIEVWRKYQEISINGDAGENIPDERILEIMFDFGEIEIRRVKTIPNNDPNAPTRKQVIRIFLRQYGVFKFPLHDPVLNAYASAIETKERGKYPKKPPPPPPSIAEDIRAVKSFWANALSLDFSVAPFVTPFINR